MSRIYFHTKYEGTAEIQGSERAWAGILCDDLFATALGVSRESRYGSERITAFRNITTGYVAYLDDEQFLQQFPVWLTGIMHNHFRIDGNLVSTYAAGINTALVVGSDPVKLLARIHGQCESHCYVAGRNREWLANIIDQGVTVGVLRKNQGWPALARRLRWRDDQPVVLSYSVTEQFPNNEIANCDENTWENISEHDAWDYAFDNLQQQSESLELKPDNWGSFYFDPGINGFAIREYVDALVNTTEGAHHASKRTME